MSPQAQLDVPTALLAEDAEAVVAFVNDIVSADVSAVLGPTWLP